MPFCPSVLRSVPRAIRPGNGLAGVRLVEDTWHDALLRVGEPCDRSALRGLRRPPLARLVRARRWLARYRDLTRDGRRPRSTRVHGDLRHAPPEGWPVHA